MRYWGFDVSSTRKRWILSIGALAVIACLGAAIYVLMPRQRGPQAVAGTQTSSAQPTMTALQVGDRFLKSLAAQEMVTAASMTSDRDGASRVLTSVKTMLGASKVATAWTNQAAPAADATEVAQQFQISWTLGADQVWTYPSALTMERAAAGWRVRWDPTIVHPKLTPGHSLGVRQPAAASNAVLDRDGKPLDPTAAPLLASAIKNQVQPPGTPAAGRVVLLDKAGAEVENLFGVEAKPTPPVTATLSAATQKAAQAAVDSVPGAAIVVAIQPSTGGILAVAQNAAAGSSPKALNGLYPPGSTFKVVTAAALLDAGKAGIDTVVPCPGRQTIGTRSIKNADFELPDGPLRTAFAQSCNTTFAALAADLSSGSLPAAAAQFGFAADFEIPGISTQTGRVESARGIPEQVENSIGQGTVQASPFGLALMTATVAKGSAVTPRLFTGVDTVVKTGYQGPPAATVKSLRTMMREVVTVGRAKALSKYGAVAGKTGTAQFGDGTRSHGWFAGYRGDVAFAVLVEDAGSAAPAVAVAGTFLEGT
ncbi:NTF2-like N-terminal transpeptidase domain-containing protein [Actinokineospora alba]|uniref:NTF2-like N-terminal transpeptidase domain-containing protein n=1 Tax=Actinokineospora alba TaxID=504798 RepID=A0A1H0MSB7_9PSEU|nr:MecA-like transpeptidase family protein [Actinokineospora alba]SDH78411.1 NTF2-like N-terminal transpeptidase domain-containing protein [Actinokineospora alba]SDO83030.1 NTF2-like N-terminal transpeptidase domain-containing protein [Actinokineospora alba]